MAAKNWFLHGTNLMEQASASRFFSQAMGEINRTFFLIKFSPIKRGNKLDMRMRLVGQDLSLVFLSKFISMQVYWSK